MFIKRSEQGEILAISKTQLAEFNEELDEQSVEIKNFLKINQPLEQSHLVNTDIELVRVIEDLIHLLTDKGVIQFTDLPGPAQRKLLSRENLRSAISELSLLNTNPDEETIHL
ncbi:hypothetical protein JX580_07435 [Thiomicrospira microaerophila]|uniref:hypothetical protein n=1 Tax=Thiomicrospira microaerophila TaxID=406020 RepID=UPI00200C2826|nr:hypothetical protein [Thiomicrospira microaerophila]UQB41517.1 hypothetical protein JX580_07435 [Thiomicrospira microaerophila]